MVAYSASFGFLSVITHFSKRTSAKSPIDIVLLGDGQDFFNTDNTYTGTRVSDNQKKENKMDYYFKSQDNRIYRNKNKDVSPVLNWTKLPQKSGKAAFSAQCREDLKEYIFDGARVFCNVTRISASGMRRSIHFYIIKDADLIRITHLISGAADFPLTDDGLTVNGCGMNMRFAVLDEIHPANNLDIRNI